MNIVINNHACTITDNNIHIENSYDVTRKSEMSEMLYAIKYVYPSCKVFEVRCWNSLLSEWQAHNRLWKLKYKRDQTGSVDLDVNEPLWRRVLYTVIGI